VAGGGASVVYTDCIANYGVSVVVVCCFCIVLSCSIFRVCQSWQTMESIVATQTTTSHLSMLNVLSRYCFNVLFVVVFRCFC
jgi:hypothetical protein